MSGQLDQLREAEEGPTVWGWHDNSTFRYSTVLGSLVLATPMRVCGLPGLPGLFGADGHTVSTAESNRS